MRCTEGSFLFLQVMIPCGWLLPGRQATFVVCNWIETCFLIREQSMHELTMDQLPFVFSLSHSASCITMARYVSYIKDAEVWLCSLLHQEKLFESPQQSYFWSWVVGVRRPCSTCARYKAQACDVQHRRKTLYWTIHLRWNRFCVQAELIGVWKSYRDYTWVGYGARGGPANRDSDHYEAWLQVLNLFLAFDGRVSLFYGRLTCKFPRCWLSLVDP